MPFPFAPIAAALGSGLGFLTGQSNINAQERVSRENTDKTIAANKAAAELAYQRDMAQWDRSNAYNSPGEQMKRLKMAGLNPMLAYGSGSVAGNSSGQSPTMSTPEQNYNYSPKGIAPIDTMGPLMAMQNYQLVKAQTDAVKATTDNTKQKTANELVQNALLEIDKQLKRQDLTAKERENLYGDREKWADLMLKQTQNKLLNQDLEQKGQIFPYQLDYQKGSLELQKNQNKKLLSDIKLQGFQGLKTVEDTKLTSKQTEVAEQDRKLKIVQRLLSSEDLTEKAYNNWLRKIGTQPDDNPLKFGTRKFSEFLNWLMNDATTGQIENW